MKVDYVVREDFDRKPGGDTFQAAQYIRDLAESVQGRIVPAGPRMTLRLGSVVHVLNVARPWDLVDTLRRASAHPIVLSPIFPDPVWLAAIRRARVKGLRSSVEKVAPQALLDSMTFVRRKGIRQAAPIILPNPFAVARTSAQVHLLNRTLGETVKHVLYLATGERAAFEKRFPGAAGLPSSVVPHSLVPVQGQNVRRDLDVLIPGRIETGKNQLHTARALSGATFSVTFVGQVNPRDRRYGQAFRSSIARSTNLRWLPGVGREEMQALYQRARLVLNPSLAEVLSLVDFEALANGCRLITTERGYTREWVAGGAEYIDPEHLDQLPSLIISALEKGVPDRSGLFGALSLQEHALKMLTTYDAVMKSS